MTDPLGGINQLFPLFGIANQLLAAVALTVCTTLLIKSGRLKWAWVTAVPLAWDAAVTLTASYQKVFSDNPKLGFFAQRDKFQAALDSGEVLPPAKDADQMQAIVTNSTVDGVLAALFAALIIVVILDAVARLGEGDPRARAAADHRGRRPVPARDRRARPGCSGPTRTARCSPRPAARTATGAAAAASAREREKAGTRSP